MILRQFIVLLVLCFMVVACNRFGGPEKPKNLISKDKMVSILIDSKLLTSGNAARKKTMEDSLVDINTYIFKKHHIDSMQFALSNSYYAFHIDEYEDIYETAIDSLERLTLHLKDVQAQEWKEQTKKEEDSLLQIAKLKDSLNPIKIKDSLAIIKNTDSLNDVFLDLNDEKKDALITPVFDTLAPQH